MQTNTVQASNAEQEKDGGGRCCTNTNSISKSANNSKRSMVKTNPDKSTNYFLAGPNCDSNNRKSAESTQQYMRNLMMCLMALGALKAHFLYS